MDIEKTVTKNIINQSDKDAVKVIVHDFIESDNAIFCSIVDADDNIISSKRVFTFNSFPCDELTEGEKNTIKNNLVEMGI